MNEVARALTKEELGVLEMIRAHYGEQNSCDEVFWPNEDEAALAIKDSSGSIVMMANLTKLANWHAEGTISTEELYDWLKISIT